MNDINGIELKVGDIIELFQTVNGQSKFVINSIDPIDISYECDTNRKYEYDMNSLLAPSYYTGEVEWEIVGSIIKEVIEPTDVIEENTLKFNPKDLSHIDEMVKHSVGRKALIETATVKHSDNWQDVATPYDICGEMCDLVVGKADKYIVFFSLEFLEVLVCEKGIDPKNITFVGDFYIEAGLAKKMYGVNTTLITKNDVIKNGKFCNEIFTLLTIDKQKEETNNCGEDNMKFNKVAVIANFPYQIQSEAQQNRSTEGGKAQAKPIYHMFIESVIDNINPNYFVSINPSRWMCGGMGLDSHRERMMNDRRMKKIVHFAGDKEVFNTVSIKGGVNYFLWEKNYDGECEFCHGNTSSKRFLNTHDIVLQDNNAFGILEKVMNKSTKFINQTCYGNKPFGLATNFSDFLTSGVKCMTVRQEEKFVDPNAFTDKNGIIGKWKVCASKGGNVTENSEGTRQVLSSIFILEPNTICTETYIVVNTFDNKKEAENFVSYMKSKFFRFMLGLRVLTQDINKKKFAWVPDMLDYSAPWTDKELLYDTTIFNFTKQEREYIESKINTI